MGQVTVTLNGRSYRLSCGDGDEQRLFELSEHVRQRIDDLSYQFKSSGDERLLVMAALMITDELWDTKAQLAALEARLAGQDWDAPHGADIATDDIGSDITEPDGMGSDDIGPHKAEFDKEPDDRSHLAKPPAEAAPDKAPVAAETDPVKQQPSAPHAGAAKSSVVQETSLKRALDRGSGPQVSLSQRLAAAQAPRKSGA